MWPFKQNKNDDNKNDDNKHNYENNFVEIYNNKVKTFKIKIDKTDNFLSIFYTYANMRGDVIVNINEIIAIQEEINYTIDLSDDIVKILLKDGMHIAYRVPYNHGNFLIDAIWEKIKEK
jgi:hypothetical protein